MKSQVRVGNVVSYGRTVARKVHKKLAFSTSQLSPELVVLADCAQLASKARGAGRSLSLV